MSGFGLGRSALVRACGAGAWTAGLVLGAPIVWAIASAVSEELGRGVRGWVFAPPWRLALSTCGWAGGIALLATIFAWPVAWAIRGRGWGLLPLVVTPLLMPGYLVYHALGQARAPGTWLGDWIELRAQGGMDWLPVFSGRVLAFVGLSLWLWPLAGIVLGGALRGVEDVMLERMQLDGAGWWRRQRVVARACAVSIACAWGLCGLVMLGSGVALHLAQAPTLAVKAWFEIMMHPMEGGVWLWTWPLLVAAGVGGWAIARGVGVSQEERGEGKEPARRKAIKARGWTWGLFVLGVVLPLLLYAMTLTDVRALGTFWRLSRDAIGQSAGVATVVAAVCGVVCVVVWFAAENGAGGAMRRLLAGALGLGLIPGVLVGQAWGLVQADAPETLQGSAVWAVLTHLTRLVFLPVLAGVWLSGTEEPALRDARLLHAGADAIGWVRVRLARGWPAAAGVVGAAWCLSVHEIEASIVVQPAGTLSLAQTMLQNLHFARLDEVSAGALVVVTPTAVVAVGGAWLAGRMRR